MNWRKAFVALLAVLPVVGLLAWGMTRDPRDIPSPLPGRVAPTFTLGVFAPGEPPLARHVGDTLALATMRGKIVVLNFWASWCLECRTEHQGLSQVARSFVGKPVQFVGVLYNDVPPAGLAWIREMGGQAYPATQDPGSRTAIDYGLYGVPETFLIDANGTVAYKHTGPIPPELLTAKLDSLLGANPAPKPGL